MYSFKIFVHFVWVRSFEVDIFCYKLNWTRFEF